MFQNQTRSNKFELNIQKFLTERTGFLSKEAENKAQRVLEEAIDA